MLLLPLGPACSHTCTMRALTDARSFHQDSVLSPMLDPLTKTLCSHQCSILSSRLCALANDACSHQDSMLSPMLRALTNARSSHQASVLSPTIRALTKTLCSHQVDSIDVMTVVIIERGTTHPTFKRLDRSALGIDRSARGQTGLHVKLAAHFRF